MLRSLFAPLALLALAAAPPPPPAPPAEPAPPHRGGRPAPAVDPLLACGGYFAARHGVTLEEGCRRMANQEHVASLSQALADDPLLGFASLWIRHEPAYAIVVAFKGGAGAAERAAVIRAAHPAIRGDLVFEAVRRTAAEIARDQDRIVAAFRPIREPWSGGYEVQADRFVFTFGSAAMVAEAGRRLPPDLRGDVDLRVGPVPVVGG